MTDLTSNTDNPTSRTATGVTGLLGLLVTALTHVVRASMHDQSAAQHALGTEQLDERVLLVAHGVALGVGVEVAQVTDVAVAVVGRPVGFAVGVDCFFTIISISILSLYIYIYIYLCRG